MIKRTLPLIVAGLIVLFAVGFVIAQDEGVGVESSPVDSVMDSVSEAGEIVEAAVVEAPAEETTEEITEVEIKSDDETVAERPSVSSSGSGGGKKTKTGASPVTDETSAVGMEGGSRQTKKLGDFTGVVELYKMDRYVERKIFINGEQILFEQEIDELGIEFSELPESLGELNSPDINGDGVVDVRDLLEVLSAWGDCVPGDLCPADLNGDGVVDREDLQVVLLFWDMVGQNFVYNSPDLNGDGFVNVEDLLMLLESWGPCTDEGTCVGDLNGDGVVDGDDLDFLLSAWNGGPGGESGLVSLRDPDVNDDGIVDVDDLLMVFSAFGECSVQCPEDVSGDGLVDVNDLALIQSLWDTEVEVNGPPVEDLVVEIMNPIGMYTYLSGIPIEFSVDLTDDVLLSCDYEIYEEETAELILSGSIDDCTPPNVLSSFDMLGEGSYSFELRVRDDSTGRTGFAGSSFDINIPDAPVEQVLDDETPIRRRGGGGSSCLTEWVVGEWSECVNGEQTRDVSKGILHCWADPADKPADVQSCVNAEISEEQAGGGIFSAITGAVIGADGNPKPWILFPFLALIGVVYAATIYGRRKVSRKRK